MTDGKKKYSDYLKERDAPDSYKEEHPVLREAPDFTRNKYFQDVETMTYGLDETEGQTNYPVDNTQEPVQPPKFDLSIPEGIKNGITKPNIQNVVTDLLGLDQPTGNKYFPNIKPVTMGDRLPFLKDRGISVNLPEKTFTPEGTIQTEGQPNQKDLTFQQKGLNQINNILLGWNQHNTGAGDAIRELLTPVYSGYERMKEGISQLPDNPIKGAGNIGLGASSEAFGLLMSPFSAIRMGAEKVGGKTAGTIAELGALTLTGGIPMIAGYFAAQGLGGLAEKISKGLELTPKETETVQEVTGLLGFLGGVKGAQKFGSMINTKLGQSVTKYAIDLERQNRLDLAPQFKTKPNLTRPVEGVTQEKLPLELLKENPEIINLLKGKENVQEQSPTGVPIQSETGISEGVRKKDTETGLQKPTKTRVETKQGKNDRQTQTNVKDVAGEITNPEKKLIKQTFGSKFQELSKPEQENILKIKSESKDYQDFKTKLSSKPPDVPVKENPAQLEGEPVNNVIGKFSDHPHARKNVKTTGDVLKKYLPQRVGDYVLSSNGTFSSGGNWRIAYERNTERTNIKTGEKYTDTNSQYVSLDSEILLSGDVNAIKTHIAERIEKAGVKNTKDVPRETPTEPTNVAPKEKQLKSELKTGETKVPPEVKTSAFEKFYGEKINDVVKKEGESKLREIQDEAFKQSELYQKGDKDYSQADYDLAITVIDEIQKYKPETSNIPKQTTEKQPFELSVEELDNTLKKIEDRWSNPEYEVKDWERKFVDEFNRLKKKTSSEVLSDLDATTEMRKRFPNADVYRGFFRNAISEGKIDSHPDYPELSKPVSKDVTPEVKPEANVEPTVKIMKQAADIVGGQDKLSELFDNYDKAIKEAKEKIGYQDLSNDDPILKSALNKEIIAREIVKEGRLPERYKKYLEVATTNNNKTEAFRMFGEGKKDRDIAVALGMKSRAGLDQVREWKKEFESEKKPKEDITKLEAELKRKEDAAKHLMGNKKGAWGVTTEADKKRSAEITKLRDKIDTLKQSENQVKPLKPETKSKGLTEENKKVLDLWKDTPEKKNAITILSRGKKLPKRYQEIYDTILQGYKYKEDIKASREESQAISKANKEKQRLETEERNKQYLDEVGSEYLNRTPDEIIADKLANGESLTDAEMKIYREEQFAPKGYFYDKEGNLQTLEKKTKTEAKKEAEEVKEIIDEELKPGLSKKTETTADFNKKRDYIVNELQKLIDDALDNKPNVNNDELPVNFRALIEKKVGAEVELNKATKGEYGDKDATFDGELEKFSKTLNLTAIKGEIKIQVPDDGIITLKDPTMSGLIKLRDNAKRLRWDKSQDYDAKTGNIVTPKGTTHAENKSLVKQEYDLKSYDEEVATAEANFNEAKKNANKKLAEVFSEQLKQLKKIDRKDLEREELYKEALTYPSIKSTIAGSQDYAKRSQALDLLELTKEFGLTKKDAFNAESLTLAKKIKDNYDSNIGDYVKELKDDIAESEATLKQFERKDGKKGYRKTNKSESRIIVRELEGIEKANKKLRYLDSWKSDVEKLLGTEPKPEPTKTEVKVEPKPLTEQSKEVKRIVSEEAYRKAKENLGDPKKINLKGGLGTVEGAKVLKDLTTVGAYHFENGLRKFGDWAKKMIEEFGDKIKPRLREIWDNLDRKSPRIQLDKALRDTKVRNEKGDVITVYSGHSNTPLYGEFDPKKATSGGFYASENPQIASGYAMGKFGVKEYYENGSQYRIKGKNGEYNKKIWQIELTEAQKRKLDELAELKNEYGEHEYRINEIMSWAKDNRDYEPLARRILARGKYDLQSIWDYNEQMGYNIAYLKENKVGENIPEFMRQRKNDTEQIMDALGIDWQSYDWIQPGVYPIYLNIKNPLDADLPFPQDLLKALKDKAKYERERNNNQIGWTTWTKDYPLKEWIRDIEEGSEGWTTQVPKKALPILKQFGYDGIKERGNKGAAGVLPREQRDINWIAFDKEQVIPKYSRASVTEQAFTQAKQRLISDESLTPKIGEKKTTNEFNEIWYNNIDKIKPYEWDEYARIRREQGYDVRNGVDAKQLIEKRMQRANNPITDKEILSALNEARGTFTLEKSDIIRDNKKVFSASKRIFGITGNPKEAGYLLPDGTMLDFSGKREGGTPNMRSYDHREITRLYEKNLSVDMEDFISRGAIRYMPENNGFYFKQAPTQKQRVLIKNLIDKANGEVLVEVGEGLERFYKEYDKGTTPFNVLKDIDNFLQHGKNKSSIASMREMLGPDRFIPDETYSQAKQNIKQKNIESLNKLGSGLGKLDPSLLKDYAVIGAYHLETVVRAGIKTGTEFRNWAKEMIADLGESIKPHLKAIWAEVAKDKDLAETLKPYRKEIPVKEIVEPIKKEVTKTEEPKKFETNVGDGETRTRGLSQTTEAKAIASDLTKGIKNLPEYDVKKNQPQIEEAAKIISTDLPRAVRIALGEEVAPNNILPGFIYKGLEDYAVRNGDVKLLKKLGQSPYLSEQATTAGQFIQSLRNQDPLSPVEAIKDVIKTRQESSAFQRQDKLKTEYESKIKDLEEKLKLKDEALESIETEKSYKKLQRETKIEQRREKRNYTRQELKLERDDLYKDLAKTFTVNVGFTADQVIILGKLTKNYAREGILSAEAVVDAIYKQIADKLDGVTKKDIRDAISGYGREVKTRIKDELQTAMDDLRQQMKTISRIEEIESGKIPVKKEIKRTEPSEELSGLKEELKTVLDEHGITDYTNLEKAKKMIKNKIVEYHDKINSGDYSKQKREPILDEERTKLQKELDDVRDKWKYVQKTLGEVISEPEAKQIAELSRIAADAKVKMGNAPRRELLKEATPEELEYGRARIRFAEYVDSLKDSANKLTFKDFKEKPFETLGKGVAHIPGVTKSLKATLDNSGLFNQHIKVLWSHPVIWQKNAIKSFQDIYHVFKGENVLAEISADIVSRPNYEKYRKDGVAVGVIEEAFPDSKLIEKIPFIGSKIHKAADTAFTGLAYRNRADLYDLYTKIAENGGNAETTGLGLGKLVNSLTGRGNLGKLEQSANTFNVLFFSPRFVKSHIDVLTAHVFDKNVSPFVKKEAGKNLLKIIGGTAAVLLTAKSMGADVELDPRSTNFGKIIIGNTRFNVTGGMGSIVTLASRLIPAIIGEGKTKTSKGELVSLNSGKYGSQTGWDVMQNFLDGKLSPVAGVARDVLKGQTFSREPVTIGNELENLLVPLPITNANELLKDPNSANIIGAMIADAVGIFTTTYSNDPNLNKVKNAILSSGEEKFSEEKRGNFYRALKQALKDNVITKSQYDDYKTNFKESQAKFGSEKQKIIFGK